MPKPYRRLLCPVALSIYVTLAPTLARAAGDPAVVSEAYVGPMTLAKHDAALSGLEALTSRLWLLPGGGYSSVFTRITEPDLPFVVVDVIPIEAGADQELGPPGAAVTLDGARLRTIATFTSERDFIIGGNNGQIDTNGYDLTLTGDLEAFGELDKLGTGTLILAGSNQWHDQQLLVSGGVLRGDSDSLQTGGR